MTNEWDFKEVTRRRRATEDNAMVREDGGGMATCKDVVLWLESYCIHRNYIEKLHMHRNHELYDTPPKMKLGQKCKKKGALNEISRAAENFARLP
jgi:hypothetical protein